MDDEQMIFMGSVSGLTEPRYYVTDDTAHGCCHVAVVIDRSRADDELAGMICECWDWQDAELIAAALNKSA